MRKDGGDHTTARPATADPFSIRPPPLPGIFGVPGSGSLIARKPREVIRQAHPLPDDDINPNNLVIPVVLASNLVFWLLLVLAAF